MAATDAKRAAGAALTGAIDRARSHSPFLREGITRHPDLIATLASSGVDAALDGAAGLAHGHGVESALRIERSGVSLVLALGDLAGLLSFEETVARLTAFADRALDSAIREAFSERSGSTDPVGFAAIALGKQGSRELNYSSDIDPIFLFDPATLPVRPREDSQQAAVRITRRVIDLLQTRTGAGYVLRVDLRLRPSPEVTPIALPIEAAVAYYESSALPWERAAFVRARAAAGDCALGDSFLTAIAPFVWRRSLDFGAIGEITGISAQIRAHHPEGQDLGPGYDLKRGRGGIREIEFFAQIQQLIHGGRDASLRAPATLDALAALRSADRVPAADAAALGEAYRTLRTIEHRLQMINDQQTHSLPDGEALDAVAKLHGLENPDGLLALLGPHVEGVRRIYDALVGEAERPGLPSDPAGVRRRLQQIGFQDPDPAARLVAGWRQGEARSLRSAAARTAFEAMLPGLMEAVSQVPDANRALHRFADIVDRLPTGVNLYRLLEARPGLVTLLAQILGHAPALAEQLARRPELLDGLIDASAFDPQPEVSILERDLSGRVAEGNYELVLDGVRRRVNERRFALGVQLISGRADPLDVAAGYARVAEAAIGALATSTIGQFSQKHGVVEGGELAIVALGRLGGGALTHASDLDLVYLFAGPVDAQSNGPQPLRATDYFNRLARRVTAALSIPTAAGPLYDVDTRLRPSGIDGMLAVSAEAFDSYQRNDAWTFEHMALARARTIFASANMRQEIDGSIAAILASERDPAKVIADAGAMRSEMARYKPAQGRFDIKRGDGGLIDLEFAVHVRQLISGQGLRPGLGAAVDELVDAGALGEAFADHQRLFARLLVTLRLVAPDGGDPPLASRVLVAKACRMSSWDDLVYAHDRARNAVSKLWRATLAGGTGYVE